MRFYSDKVMALSELMEDNLFNKIPLHSVAYYVNKSMDLGIETAGKFKGNLSLETLLEKYRIKVTLFDKEYRLGTIRFRAEILPKERKINIMKPSIDDLASRVADILPERSVTLQEILNIHIAHELYHMKEYDDGMTSRKLEPVNIFKFLGFVHKGYILKTSEIAAHSFCKAFLELDFHPKNLDYSYLISKGDITEEKLNEHLMENSLKYLNSDKIFKEQT